MKSLIVLLFSMYACQSYANCTNATGPDDGVPPEYYHEKCFAEEAFATGDYDLASLNYNKSLSFKSFEAPKYSLRLELAESLCRSEKFSEGIKAIDSYSLITKAELGEIKCPTDTEEMMKSLHI